MGRDKKRREGSSSSSSRVDYKKRHRSSSPVHDSPAGKHKVGKRPTFASYLDTPNLPPKVKLLCEIIANTPSLSIEKVLDDTGVRIFQEDVEQVLKLSYGFAGPSVKFFRWAGYQLNDSHSPYSWNLVVDLLGKNSLFDAMWDAIKSMKKEGLLSLATFASVFSSYVIADRVPEAIMTFEVMEQYGCPCDIVALNSLISAICRDGKAAEARDFLDDAKGKIRLDADTYAILLEGWENEKDVNSARRTFGEMVLDIGWDPNNVPAYDSYLSTLLKGPDGMREAFRIFDTMQSRGCCPGIKFLKVALKECVRKGDAKAAELLWEAMVDRNKCEADTEMYNSMIALHCYVNDIDLAMGLMDRMVYNGAFPDGQSYNVLLHFLIKSKRLKEASPLFIEMTQNECVPTHENCNSAIRVYVDSGDLYTAIKIWKCMIENYDSELDEAGNMLIVGLRDRKRLPEAVKYAEDMIDRKIKLNSSTLSKLKQGLSKAGKEPVYDQLLRKWKLH